MMRQCEMKGEAAVCHQAQWQHERTPRGMTTRGHFVCPGGPADGRLVPGDQLVKINNVAVDDLTPEQAAEIIRSLPTAHTQGPKSSFITPEKRAKLRSNPVKVHFAEEVEVNGHSQGNALLFLPNVLKVYLENGQTKAFKFEPNTTVKDIVMTLKEKLSLSRIEHFSLVLELQHSISKLLLLHEEERIQQVVQRKEAHDYRCLFRVCFIPKNLQTLLQEDPIAFMYLYLQGVNDVLQERFAIEMRCNTALRLAALHIRERLASCGQSPKTNLKIITKTWGIDNFVSSTLLRNMREKDLRKAIAYHMKKSQSQHDPKQKGLPVDQARINYLEELSDLKSFGGKSFSATMMLQDRESMVTLLVGARYGVSQVVNHKLSILSTLTEFSSITRIELLPESDKVSLVKIYLQDIKPITLLLESVAAKDMSCLIAGYCRVFGEPNLNIFPWIDDSKMHRVSAEEGRGKKCIYIEHSGHENDLRSDLWGHEGKVGGGDELPASEASDSCRSDSQVLTSPSCDSLDALEEDDLISCSSSAVHTDAPSQPPAAQLHHYPYSHTQPHLLAPPPAHSHPLIQLAAHDREGGGCRRSGDRDDPQPGDARCYYNICSNITPDSARSLPHQMGGDQGEDCEAVKGEPGSAVDLEPIPILQPPPGFGDSSSDEEFYDARDRLTSPEDPTSGAMPREVFLACPAKKRSDVFLFPISLSFCKYGQPDEDRDGGAEEGGASETLFQLRKRSRKRRSFMETDYTSTVSYPEPDPEAKKDVVFSRLHKNPSPTVSSLTHPEGEPTQLESKPILSIPCMPGPASPCGFGSREESRDAKLPSRTRKQEMEMEPDAMESKSVIGLAKAAPPSITVVRCRVDPDGKECSDRRGDGKEEGEGQEEIGEGKEEGEKDETLSMSESGLFAGHMFLPGIFKEKDRGEVGKEEGGKGSLCRPFMGTERQPEAKTLPMCLIDVNEKGSIGLLRAHLMALEQNSHVEEHVFKGMCENSPPPPPPPSSPLPLIPVIHKSQSDCWVREEGDKENKAMSTQMSLSNSIEMLLCQQNHSDKAQSEGTACDSEVEARSVLSSTMTASDEVTDSTNSDNVFEDDEASITLNSCSSEQKYDSMLGTKQNVIANSATVGKGESQITVRGQTSTEAQTRIHPLNTDYTRTINSITAKLGAATSATSPTFHSGTKLKSEVTSESASHVVLNEEKPRCDFTTASVEGKDVLIGPSFKKASTVEDLSKDPSSPTHFHFQTSPSIMGSLSASTLRGKIQKLPLYLSRSQETLNQGGLGNSALSPNADHRRENVEINITDVDDVTQSIDFEMDTNAESVESDDSDTTVTGSEVDGEFFVEPTSTKSFYSVPEEKEVSIPSPVQTEPKSPNHLLYTGPIKNTPGPVTRPPASIVNSLQGDTPGPKMDIPGPITDPPHSVPTAIVVTTQNLNGPGLPFHGQPRTVTRKSSDRPLIGLYRPTVQNSESSKPLSPGCRVFTICEDPSQTNDPDEVEQTLPLKSELGCNSLLASGCESIMEVDACGCPAVYTDCFSGGDSFDEELTVYEFSCRTQNSGVTQTSRAVPIMTSPPVPSFLSTSSTHSPFFARSTLFSPSTSELSPLLSPLSDTTFLSQTHKDTISRLGQQRYPEPPKGFQVLRVDVDQLLSILESSGADRSLAGHGGRHPRDTCPAHFTENKRVLQTEARQLMASCQKVVGTGQSPEEMLHCLADSFRTLVELAGICLWFSGCDRCDRRNAEAVAGLADVARSFRDFCLAAERVSNKRSCQDLSTKLLAKQCTALTASVFCLTQLFRTLTAL
uniref:FERM and PDZ domain containing 1b n=1 Tax=Mola mola TaxID=94237 RepID=A0A3Q3VZ12_MOLML